MLCKSVIGRFHLSRALCNLKFLNFSRFGSIELNLRACFALKSINLGKTWFDSAKPNHQNLKKMTKKLKTSISSGRNFWIESKVQIKFESLTVYEYYFWVNFRAMFFVHFSRSCSKYILSSLKFSWNTTLYSCYLFAVKELNILFKLVLGRNLFFVKYFESLTLFLQY